LVEVDHRRRGRGVVAGEHQAERIVEDVLDHQVPELDGVGGVVVDDRKIDPSLVEEPERGVGVGLGEHERGVRVTALQLGGGAGQEVGAGRGEGRDANRFVAARAQVLDLAAGLVHRLQDAQRVPERDLALRREADAERRPVDEVDAQFPFERGDVLGDGGLGQRQRGGGPGEGPFEGDRSQDAQALQALHPATIAKAYALQRKRALPAYPDRSYVAPMTSERGPSLGGGLLAMHHGQAPLVIPNVWDAGPTAPEQRN
jgi:hypothetical protein